MSEITQTLPSVISCFNVINLKYWKEEGKLYLLTLKYFKISSVFCDKKYHTALVHFNRI